MGAPIRVPPTRPSTPTFEHQLPPTRPSTPTFGRIERIAEAPSRADPNLPLVETSSPIQAPPSPMEASQPDRVNSNDPGDDTTEGNEQNGHQTTSDSNPALPAGNGDHDEPTEDMRLSSCSRRSYIPTPYNSPIARNPRQRSPNGVPSTRLRGGGPKRFAGSPITPAAKKSKFILNGRGNKKDRMYNDAEAVLADGNSPLYDDADVTAILQHPTAVKTLEGLPMYDHLQGLSPDALRQAVNDFISNGRSGYHDPDYLGQGLAARVVRGRGEFDEYLEHMFQETWIHREGEGEDEKAAASDENPAKSA